MWKYNSTELYHYGVKGMKWGVRRSREQLRYNRYSITAIFARNLHTIHTPNGVKVTCIGEHALDRIETRDDRKVTAREIIDALNKPLNDVSKEKIRLDNNGNRSIRYIGRKATVNVNPDTGVIPTVWKTGHKAIRKYTKKG